VQALSEYMPRFTAVIDPFRGTFWLALSTAAVVTVRSNAPIVIAIIATLDSFLNSMLLHSQ
jgi:hypothetical protein